MSHHFRNSGCTYVTLDFSDCLLCSIKTHSDITMVTASQIERRLSVLRLNSSKVELQTQSRLFYALYICVLFVHQGSIYRSRWTWAVIKLNYVCSSYCPLPDLKLFYSSCFLCLSHWSWVYTVQVLIRSLIRHHYNHLRTVLPWVYHLFQIWFVLFFFFIFIPFFCCPSHFKVHYHLKVWDQ